MRTGVNQPISASASGLNDGGFTLADRSLAFAYATGKAKGENHRADDDQQFSHRDPRFKYRNQYSHYFVYF